MSVKKNRKQKSKEYEQKYGHIPVEYNERLSWMVDYYKLSPSKMQEILIKRQTMLENLFYYDYNVIELYIFLLYNAFKYLSLISTLGRIE